MSESQNFSNYPRSINEVRSDKSGEAADWSPRECLIAMLREIDEGNIAPEYVVIAWAGRGTTADNTVGDYAAGKDYRLGIAALFSALSRRTQS
jgi:hypothetical protein